MRITASRLQSANLIWLAGCLAACLLLMLSACGSGRSALGREAPSAFIQHAGDNIDPEVQSFYVQRQFRPLWFDGSRVKPEARTALAMMRAAAEHGLDPSQYGLPGIEAAILKRQSQDEAAPIRADILLSQSFA